MQQHQQMKEFTAVHLSERNRMLIEDILRSADKEAFTQDIDADHAQVVEVGGDELSLPSDTDADLDSGVTSLVTATAETLDFRYGRRNRDGDLASVSSRSERKTDGSNSDAESSGSDESDEDGDVHEEAADEDNVVADVWYDQETKTSAVGKRGLLAGDARSAGAAGSELVELHRLDEYDDLDTAAQAARVTPAPATVKTPGSTPIARVIDALTGELSKMGFTAADAHKGSKVMIQRRVKAGQPVSMDLLRSTTDSVSSVISDALDWLLLNIPEHRLPKQYDPRGKQLEVVSGGALKSSAPASATAATAKAGVCNSGSPPGGASTDSNASKAVPNALAGKVIGELLALGFPEHVCRKAVLDSLASAPSHAQSEVALRTSALEKVYGDLYRALLPAVYNDQRPPFGGN